MLKIHGQLQCMVLTFVRGKAIGLTDKSLLASSISAEILVPLVFENDNMETPS